MKRQIISRYALALAVLMAAAGTITVATSPVTAPAAQAFGLGSITMPPRRSAAP